jgi:hypothetical protein
MNTIPPKTTIPQNAESKVIARYDSGAPKQIDYAVAGKIIARRWVAENDENSYIESQIKNGKEHGLKIFVDDGEVNNIEPYLEGLPHGTAEQWCEGELIGTYEMVHGTGIDLWRAKGEDGSTPLQEVHYMKDGKPHGFEWWIDFGQRTVNWERHWYDGEFHGIERKWNTGGKMCLGYPRYYVRGKKVDKRKYLRISSRDTTLPVFRQSDNRPERDFPEEIKEVLSFPNVRTGKEHKMVGKS